MNDTNNTTENTDKTSENSTEKKKTKSTWFAVGQTKEGTNVILRAKTQRDLQALLKTKDITITTVIRGKEFTFRVQKSFTFAGGDTIEAAA